jgi:hypothetical protein
MAMDWAKNTGYNGIVPPENPPNSLLIGQVLRSKEGWHYVYMGVAHSNSHVFVMTHPRPKNVSVFDHSWQGVKPETLIKKFPCLGGKI